ncbi:UNVERIFIED_CONTAM: hypothetical protein Sradi_1693500 [Sesamum radiatum]|uniref:Myb/SANT-like domain-containing protein n=1 Tax=Sesamum radiatum TaxID=300843 RepID=A0AAW2UEA3_SESRA
MFLTKPTSIPEDRLDVRWRWFKDCLDVLDGMYIDVRVSEHEKGSWEGSAADNRVLRDAIPRPNGLRVPSGSYNLCDNGYTNAEGFLTPYRGCVAIAPNSMNPSFTSTKDESSSRFPHRGAHKERSGTRRTWTLKEEEVLLNGLKMLVASGWKCDNGFHNDYLAQLEAHMSKAFPNCDLKAEPHISLKMHFWKKQYSTLVIMFSKSGLGWDESRNMIVVDDDNAWDEYVKVGQSLYYRMCVLYSFMLAFSPS